MSQLNTKEKCTIRDLIKIEIKSLTKVGYGQYKYFDVDANGIRCASKSWEITEVKV